jgi:hypothetical protein
MSWNYRGASSVSEHINEAQSGSDEVQKVKETFAELENLLSKIYESKQEELTQEFFVGTNQLIVRLGKMSDENFEKVKADIPLINYLTLFSVAMVKIGQPERGNALAAAAATVFLHNGEPDSMVTIVKIVGQELFSKESFKLAHDIFMFGANASQSILDNVLPDPDKLPDLEPHEIEFMVLASLVQTEAQVRNTCETLFVHADEREQRKWTLTNQQFTLLAYSSTICEKEAVSKRGLQPVFGLLEKGRNPYDRAAAARAVGMLNPPNATAMLLKALEDKDSSVRAEVLDTLQDMGDKRVLPSLVKFLSDEEDFVRFHAVTVFGVLGDRTAIPTLNNMRKSATDSMKGCIDWAIEEIEARATDERA